MARGLIFENKRRTLNSELEEEQHLTITYGRLPEHLISVFPIPSHKIKDFSCKYLADEISIHEFLFTTASRPSQRVRSIREA